MAIEIFNLFDILYIVSIVVVITCSNATSANAPRRKQSFMSNPNTRVIVVQQLLVYLTCDNGIS